MFNSAQMSRFAIVLGVLLLLMIAVSGMEAGADSGQAIAAVTSAEAMEHDGQWQGQGSVESGDCAAFLISVSVRNQTIVGKIIHGEDDYSVTGQLSSEGQFRGEVSYLWYTIAKLTGEVTSGRGTGSWRTLKGPKCAGRFDVEQIRDAGASELANRSNGLRTQPTMSN